MVFRLSTTASQILAMQHVQGRNGSLYSRTMCLKGIFFPVDIYHEWTSLLTDTSLQGTPLFRRHLSSGDTSLQEMLLFREHLSSGDTSLQETPLFRRRFSSGETSLQGTPLFRGHLSSGDASLQETPLFRGHLSSGHILID